MSKRANLLLLLFVLSIAGSIAKLVPKKSLGECEADDGSCDATAVPDKRHARSKCEDKESDCKGWADMGECETNPNYMLRE